jgi:polysaccharide deacetylase family protein (PEP-CTERM system associated)
VRHPALIREIAAAGHEIACHSHDHPVVYELDEAAFSADLERALAALAACGVTDVAGYRAPSFSLTPPVHRYLELLRRRGLRYDASLFPVRHPRYGQPSAPRRPLLLEGERGERPLVLVPMTTARIGGVNVPFSGGGYLRLLPLAVYRACRSVARRQGVPIILYLHPWELDTHRPDVGLGRLARLRSQGGQLTLPAKLEAILSEGEFQPMGEFVAKRLAAGDLPRGRLPLAGGRGGARASSRAR